MSREQTPPLQDLGRTSRVTRLKNVPPRPVQEPGRKLWGAGVVPPATPQTPRRPLQ